MKIGIAKTDAFMKATQLYADFQGLEKQLKTEYDRAADSGQYSKGYLADLAEDHRRQLQGQRSTVNRKLSAIRADLEADLKYRNDITRCHPNTMLQSYLACLPSDTTSDEFVRIMETKGLTALDRRMIQETARQHGYRLTSAPTTAEGLEKFDKLARQINQGLSADSATMRSIIANVMMSADALAAECDDPKVTCVKIADGKDWQSVAEAINAEIQQTADETTRKATEAEIDAFRQNLHSATPEALERLTQSENGDPDGLTASERHSAETIARYSTGGKVTPEIVAYIKSERDA